MPKWLSGCIGLAIVAIAVFSTASVRRFVQGSIRAEGVVVSLSAGGSHPRIRFTTADGQVVTFSGGGLIFGYAVGQKAEVVYTPNAAQQTASLAAFGSLWFLPIILLAISVVWLFVSLGVF